jgi:hypothetical protein
MGTVRAMAADVGFFEISIDATRQMWAFFREHQLPRK